MHINWSRIKSYSNQNWQENLFVIEGFQVSVDFLVISGRSYTMAFSKGD
jgi:hypothetical protein